MLALSSETVSGLWQQILLR